MTRNKELENKQVGGRSLYGLPPTCLFYRGLLPDSWQFDLKKGWWRKCHQTLKKTPATIYGDT